MCASMNMPELRKSPWPMMGCTVSFSVETSDLYGTGHMLTSDHGLCVFKGTAEIVT